MPLHDSIQILAQTREHARRLCDMLEKQEAELAAADSIDPQTKDSGLAAIRRAIESARRLYADAQDAVEGRRSAGGDSGPDFGKGESQ
jgi:hypothetical protein